MPAQGVGVVRHSDQTGFPATKLRKVGLLALERRLLLPGSGSAWQGVTSKRGQLGRSGTAAKSQFEVLLTAYLHSER